MTTHNQPVPHESKSSPVAAPAKRLAHLWRRHGWLIIGLLWVVALILGYIGWCINAASEGKRRA